MDTLWFTLGIAFGASLRDSKPMNARKLLAPLTTLVTLLGTAATVLVLVLLRFPGQSCDYGTLYQPCFHFAKFALVALLAVATFACAVSAWFFAANEARARTSR